MINVIVKHIFKLVSFFVTFPKEAKALLKVSQLWYKYSYLPSSVLSIHYKVEGATFKVGRYSIFNAPNDTRSAKIPRYSIYRQN